MTDDGGHGWDPVALIRALQQQATLREQQIVILLARNNETERQLNKVRGVLGQLVQAAAEALTNEEGEKLDQR